MPRNLRDQAVEARTLLSDFAAVDHSRTRGAKERRIALVGYWLSIETRFLKNLANDVDQALDVLFGFDTAVPALTEDIDVAIPECLAAERGDEIVATLALAGFRHEAGTAIFTDDGGATFDLLGHGDPARGDIDTTLVRPLGGPPRLLAAVVDDDDAPSSPRLRRSRPLPSGHRVVTRERLQRALIGAVGDAGRSVRARRGANDPDPPRVSRAKRSRASG